MEGKLVLLVDCGMKGSRRMWLLFLLSVSFDVLGICKRAMFI